MPASIRRTDTALSTVVRARIPFIVLTITAMSVLIAGCSDDPQRVEHETDGFSIRIPEGWEANPDALGVAMTTFPSDRTKRGMAFTVDVLPLPAEATDENFSQLVLDDARASSEGYREIGTGNVEIDGRSVPFLVYSYSLQGNDFTAFITSITNSDEGKGYVISGTSLTAMYPQAEQTLRDLATSFELE